MNETDYSKIKITRGNFSELLKTYLKEKSVNERIIADSIGCSEHVIKRIINEETYPSDEMLVSGTALFGIGHVAYKMLSEKDKSRIFEKIGAVIGGGISINIIIEALLHISKGGALLRRGILFQNISLVGRGLGYNVAGVTYFIIPTILAIIGADVGRKIERTLRNRNQKIDGRWESIIITNETKEDEIGTSKCDGFTVFNFRNILAAFMEKNNLEVEDVANSIGCSELSLARILDGKTWPTDETLKQGAILIAVGFDVYKKLKRVDKEKISEAMGSVGGGVLGFGSIAGVISVLGTQGLSAVGISTGLTTLGGIVGASMIGGVIVTACFPIAAGAAGYFVVKAVKKFLGSRKAESEDFDPKWERPIEVFHESKIDDSTEIKGDGFIFSNANSV